VVAPQRQHCSSSSKAAAQQQKKQQHLAASRSSSNKVWWHQLLPSGGAFKRVMYTRQLLLPVCRQCTASEHKFGHVLAHVLYKLALHVCYSPWLQQAQSARLLLLLLG
jgi:hypothetical protein